ncbi:MAG: hypothetical protein AB1779_10340 [Candidatus Thermoplasmatota archaeon]
MYSLLHILDIINQVGEGDPCSGFIVFCTILIIIIGLIIIFFIALSKKEAEKVESYRIEQLYPQQPKYQYPQQQEYYYTRPSSYLYPYSITQPKVEKKERKKVVRADICPRCESRDLIAFPDGHIKCKNCKKIFFSG